MLYFSKTFIFLENLLKDTEKVVFFCVFGIALPCTILFYRIALILTEKAFLLNLCFFFSVNNSVWEPILLCYVPNIFLFILLRKKKLSFFTQFLRLCTFLFLFFSKIAKIECFFLNHVVSGFFFLFIYFCIYILVAYKGDLLEILFLTLRQVVISYYAFKRFFDSMKTQEEFQRLPFYIPFLKIFRELQTEEKESKADVFYGISSAVFICLYRSNNTIKYELENYQRCFEQTLYSLEKNKDRCSLKDLYVEQESIFAFQAIQKRKPFFFFLALEFFTKVLKRCELFDKKLKSIPFTFY